MKSKTYFASLGEIMLRLSSPGHERLFQSPRLDARFGGGEANVALSLANFGLLSRFITAVPPNVIGDRVFQYLRQYNVDTNHIVRDGSRLGIYFLETGSGPRPSKVIYDRAYSAISKVKHDMFNWEEIFSDVQWFHITGITPAISATAAKLAETAISEAKSRNITVSCDLNYRSKLWKYGKQPHEIMRKLVESVDVIIANEEDIQKTLNYPLDQKIGGTQLKQKKYESLIDRVITDFPHLKYIAITLRESFSADHNDWSALLYVNETRSYYYSQKYRLKNIIDRVGGGDSFAAGLIYGITQKPDPQAALEFAVAASALKHTIPGDANLVSVSEVEQLSQGEAHGRVQR